MDFNIIILGIYMIYYIIVVVVFNLLGDSIRDILDPGQEA